MRRIATGLLACLLAACVLAACGEAGGINAKTDADTLTRRQKDSLIAHSNLPGAPVVGRAMKAADQEKEHQRILDSLSGG